MLFTSNKSFQYNIRGLEQHKKSRKYNCSMSFTYNNMVSCMFENIEINQLEGNT